jgi:glycosyltransferase involved in cell wall biosynthesis
MSAVVNHDRTVSVIIPCRNAAKWIGQALESVLAQTEVELDVIVIDDGSDDDSMRIAGMAGPKVKIAWQTPQGVSAARNAGTQLALGGFLQYLDADDVLMPGTLAARVAFLNASGAEVALTAWERWHDGAVARRQRDEVVRRTLGPRPDIDLLTDAWWPPAAILYRRSIVNRVGPWRRDLPVIQDARYLLDAALAGARFVHLDQVGARYRVHGNSLSRRNSRAFIEDCYRSAADLHDRWKRSAELDLDRQRALTRVYAHVARPLFSTDRRLFREVVERIGELDPKFRPESPASLRMLTGIVGYPAAEQIASWWRLMKRASGIAS